MFAYLACMSVCVPYLCSASWGFRSLWLELQMVVSHHGLLGIEPQKQPVFLTTGPSPHPTSCGLVYAIICLWNCISHWLSTRLIDGHSIEYPSYSPSEWLLSQTPYTLCPCCFYFVGMWLFFPHSSLRHVIGYPNWNLQGIQRSPTSCFPRVFRIYTNTRSSFLTFFPAI